MAHVRMEPDARKELIMAAAMKVAARKGGIKKATRTAIASEGKFSVGLINVYFGNRAELRQAIVEHAVASKHVGIVRDALNMGMKFNAPRQLLRDAKTA